MTATESREDLMDDPQGATRPPRVLVVDDDAGIRGLLMSALSFAGYEVDVASDVEQALDRVRAGTPDVIVMDVMLPGGSGFDVVQLIRGKAIDVPILFLTARDAIEDRVRGLQIGGDDYVVKPFSISEVGARIEALLRRAAGGNSAGDGVVRVHDLVVDPLRHEVERAGERIQLSPTEFKLLHYLVAHPGQVLSKSQILESVWHYDFGGSSLVVERFISNLRRKIDGGREPLIQTVRGVGYSVRRQSPRTHQ